MKAPYLFALLFAVSYALTFLLVPHFNPRGMAQPLRLAFLVLGLAMLTGAIGTIVTTLGPAPSAQDPATLNQTHD